jgi:uncharacterized protein CbrC (UPF0167 family)
MELPIFKYHPSPIATGSIVPSAEVCPVCGESRGFAYDSIPYGMNELEHICPWCIASGSAHEKFGVEFTDTEGVGGQGQWEKVPKEVVEEVAFRTPGFAGLAAGLFVRWGLDLSMSVGAIAMSASTIIVAANAQLLRRLKLQRATHKT